MGGCGSRNQKAKSAQTKFDELPADVRPPPGLKKPEFTLRSDAQPFVPPEAEVEPTYDPKEPWEMFLDKKQALLRQQKNGQFFRQRDGTYTSEYRGMLVQPWSAKGAKGKGRGQSPTRGGKGDFDVLRSWRDAAVKRPEAKVEPADAKKKRKSTPLKKAILAQRAACPPSTAWLKFDAHLQKFNATKVAPEGPKPLLDDTDALGREHPPFALSDRCYASDHEDGRRSHRHSASIPLEVREYVTQPITPELEEAVTETLFHLRHLKKQEKGLGLPGRRYAVGFREVARLVSQKKLQALVVAPDVERTSGGALEAAIDRVVTDCKEHGIPVVYALSRRQLGHAIQKNVAISVFAVQDVRGCEDSLKRVLALAEAAAS
jgi:ribosomal protein L7Ae-like RNA K-turn-binding protein